VNATGFGPVTRRNIEVSVGAQLTIDLSLAVGTTAITVDVRSSAVAQANSTSGEQSTLIDPEQMRDLLGVQRTVACGVLQHLQPHEPWIPELRRRHGRTQQRFASQPRSDDIAQYGGCGPDPVDNQ
jgi:hypothetical protein